jgi:hypothetical protein
MRNTSAIEIYFNVSFCAKEHFLSIYKKESHTNKYIDWNKEKETNQAKN